MKIAILVWLALLASAAPARAQEQEMAQATQFEQRLIELAEWLREYEAWEKWFELWGNRVARNFDDQPLWERVKRPGPPVWLAAECQAALIPEGPLASACAILRHWDEHPLLIVQRRDSSFLTSAKPEEPVSNSRFLQRVHLTGLWMEARYPSRSAYGIVGLQIGVFETGRFTLPAVGMMVVMIPDGDGGHAWKPATTLGFGYRICDFVPPFVRTQASLHVNIARTRLHGVHDERILPGMVNVNFVGLSVSARRRR
jgi:hypothetical protein